MKAPLAAHKNTRETDRKAKAMRQITFTAIAFGIAVTMVASQAGAAEQTPGGLLVAQQDDSLLAPAPDTAVQASADDLLLSPNDKDAEAAAAMIPQPTNPIEAAAFQALDRNCARCHQFGKLDGRQKPAHGFGNVLYLEQMAKDPSLVIPGNPDGSKLVQTILNKNMPYDYYQDGKTSIDPPSQSEVAAIRNWISSLAEVRAAACASHTFIGNDQVLHMVSDDINHLQDYRVAGTRYIVLTNLYNACSNDDEMKVYRQGTIKLLNSLSRNSDLVKLETIDPAQTIIRFNLDDVKWSPEDWNRIAEVYPYAVKPDAREYDFVSTQLNTAVPIVRGDWLAFTASRPPLYDALIKLPDTFQELKRQLGVDVEKDIENFVAVRSGFQKSLVSENNRLIERHTISTGVFWTSYDFAGNAGVQSLFEHPLGPGGKDGFQHNGGETVFSLPNGLNGYYLNTADGKRLDKGPTNIVRDKDRKDLAVANGISCFGCHDHGFRMARDDIREHVIHDRNFPKDVRKAVEALYPPHEVVDKYLADDTARFEDAMRRAGLDPSLKLDGIEMINALSNKYEKDVDLNLAAAEFGLKLDAFEAAAGDLGGDARNLLNRLQQSVVPRDNFEDQFPKLVAELTDGESLFNKDYQPVTVAKVNTADTRIDGDIHLSLFATKTAYHQNELPVFIVQSDHDCHLTLVDVDDKGTGTVLFPNKFENDTLIKANQAFEYPRPDAPFQFRLKDIGTETVIALCNAKASAVDTIVHHFQQKDFTDLGDYNKFVTRAIAVEAKQVKAAPVTKVSDVPVNSGVARVAIKLTVTGQ